MNLLRNLVFYFIFYSWTVFFFLIFSPVKLFSKKFLLFLSNLWTSKVIEITKRILKIDYELIGIKNIPKNSSFLITSNHQSAWETFFLSFFFKGSIFILKEELKRIPLMSLYFKELGFIFINRNSGFKSIKNIISSIKELEKKGVRKFIIFPEGTRIPVNSKGQINPGVFAIHKILKIPVLPIKHNSGRYWKNKRFIKEPGKIRVEFHPVIRNTFNKKLFMEKIEKIFY